MGEIADLMLGGKLCCGCGVCLEEEVIKLDLEIPVMCHDCHSEYQEKCGVPHMGEKGGIMCENFYLVDNN